MAETLHPSHFITLKLDVLGRPWYSSIGLCYSHLCLHLSLLLTLVSSPFFVTPNCVFAFLSVAPRGQRRACLDHHPRPESTRRRRGGRRGRSGGGGGGIVAPQNGFDRDRRISRRCRGLRVASEEGLEGIAKRGLPFFMQ